MELDELKDSIHGDPETRWIDDLGSSTIIVSESKVVYKCHVQGKVNPDVRYVHFMQGFTGTMKGNHCVIEKRAYCTLGGDFNHVIPKLIGEDRGNGNVLHSGIQPSQEIKAFTSNDMTECVVVNCKALGLCIIRCEKNEMNTDEVSRIHTGKLHSGYCLKCAQDLYEKSCIEPDCDSIVKEIFEYGQTDNKNKK